MSIASKWPVVLVSGLIPSSVSFSLSSSVVYLTCISHTHAGASGHTVHINSMAIVMNKFVLLCRHIILCDLVDLKQMPSPSPLLHVHVAVVTCKTIYNQWKLKGLAVDFAEIIIAIACSSSWLSGIYWQWCLYIQLQAWSLSYAVGYIQLQAWSLSYAVGYIQLQAWPWVWL